MISMKNMEKKENNLFSPRFVSMEMVAIFDFRALTKVHLTLKPLLQMHERLHTHRRYTNEEMYRSVFTFVA